MKKTCSYTAMHFTIAFGVAWMLTGDFVVGGLVAIVEPAVNSVAYFFHERAWARIAARPSVVA
ncbi:DUF2061 domain-containing protein [Saccharophagus degradans]|uniref:Membrane protein n=2 Tax=Saccharophagus degradans TaxID=86304 RepID=Q21J06_SACD2|nr:DUF2061 domain-containing protein [Saccharophagus degradans]ABD81323.1 membrane protein [Saccharophagus degradans 2-40]MBU2985727.1 DUF2061 domain-containing protein [Saccharophagus degradans]MDO6421121.1 DUF2061 domain-containing protein [Saccharophagus degradans]MDO6605968.1 DUF2061 domain-containing protein [Saccharophagus degradans]WGP00440.1 DUF2061 domain-containing protein [Saccharophagus degradans]